MNRRKFLDWLLRISGAVLGALAAYPVIRYLVPPREPEAATRQVIAAKKEEVPSDGYKIFPFGTEPGILIHLASGEYRSFSAVCTHLGCTVQYRSAEKDIWCACHNGIYDLHGKNVSGPPPRPLAPYDVHLMEQDIVVQKPGSS